MSYSTDVLNRAFISDPNAFHALICNRVPCNKALADDPYIIVEAPPVLDDKPQSFQVGLLGVINGILIANGLPAVAAKFEDVGMYDTKQFVGFVDVSQEEFQKLLR